MIRSRLILSLAFMLAGALSAFAQPRIEVQVPNIVGLNEQFNITFVISGDKSPSDFKWTCSDDFQLVWGPQRGSMTTFSSATGRSSQNTYTYTLRPKRTGKFRIPAADISVDGAQYRSDSPKIEVVAESHSQSGAQDSRQQQQQVTGTVSDNDLYMTLTADKRSVVVGETVTVTLKLYHRVSLVGFENATFPSFNNCWSQESYAPTNLEFKRESIGGQLYNTSVIRTWKVVPQSPGELHIDPAGLVCLVNVRVNRPSTGSIFDSFFQDDYQTIRKRISTAALNLSVRSLPAGAPASFGGGVGRFSMSAAVTRSELTVHDASSLEIRVTGTGNTSLLEAPRVNFPPDFEVYDVKTSDISGGKLFEYPFIPRSHGEFTIPAVEYSFYDISAGRYVTLTSDPIHLDVARGSGTSARMDGTLSAPAGTVQRRDVRDIGSDIRYMSAKFPGLAPEGSFFVGSGLFWILWTVLALAAAGIGLALRSMAARRADVAGSKNRAAMKLATKRLAQTKVFLDQRLYTAFYEELHRALLGYVSDKFNIDAADMNKDNMAERFAAAGISGQVSADFIALVDACEYARYAPDSGHEAMSAHYGSAVSTITSIEDAMKKNSRKNSHVTAVVAALMMLLPAAAGTADLSAAGTIGRQEAETLWEAGSTAYAEGRWDDAIAAWTELRSAGRVAPELYYNLGNAYFKKDDVAHAILWYERALKLDPSNADARFNLGLANSRTQDNIDEVPEFFLARWMRSLCYCMPSDTWAVLATVLFAMTLGLLLLFLLGPSRKARISGFVCGIAALLLCIFTLSMASWQKSDFRSDDSAIITRPVAVVRSSPADNTAKDLFVLHEGTKVNVLDELGGWLNIELSDGRQGWIAAGDLEII